MNILFIGPYHQMDIWGEASYRHLKLLYSIKDVNLVCRQLNFNNVKREKEQWIEELEIKTEKKYDRIIQFCLPQYYVSSPNSIGMVIIEPYILKDKKWLRSLNIMPEIIVSSELEKISLVNAGIKSKIYVIPPMIEEFICLKSPPIKELGKSYIFYWIGEYNNRTNYKTIIRAFHSEFNRFDNVHLAMYFICEPTEELVKQIYNEIYTIKTDLNNYNNNCSYKEDTITIGKKIEEIREYHDFCDCIIDISSGSNCNPNVGEAMIRRKDVIANKFSGLNEFFIHNDCIYSPESVLESVGFPYDIKSRWKNPCQISVQEHMRKAYKQKKEKKYDIDHFKYKNVSKLWKDILIKNNN